MQDAIKQPTRALIGRHVTTQSARETPLEETVSMATNIGIFGNGNLVENWLPSASDSPIVGVYAAEHTMCGCRGSTERAIRLLADKLPLTLSGVRGYLPRSKH